MYASLDIGKGFDPMLLGGTPGVTRHHLILLKARDLLRSKALYLRRGELLFRGLRHSFPMRMTYWLNQDWCDLGYFHGSDSPSWIDGVLLKPGTSFIAGPGSRNELLMGEGGSWTSILIGMDYLRQNFGPEIAGQVARSRTFRAVASAAEPMRRCFERMRSRLLDGDVEAQLDPIEHIVVSFLGALGGTNVSPALADARLQPAHYRLVRQAELFLNDNLRNDLYMAELCRSLGCSDRSLRYAFQAVLQVSPQNYFSVLRLSHARRQLMLADPQRSSVRAVATALGYWNLSRFAESYRQLFGELPSETLARDIRNIAT